MENVKSLACRKVLAGSGLDARDARISPHLLVEGVDPGEAKRLRQYEMIVIGE